MKQNGKVYLIKTCYNPNDAPTNRFLSFLEGFSQLGKDVEAVFVLSDIKNSKIEKQWPHVKVNYLWEHCNVKNRFLRQISYSFLSRRFVKQVHEGDTVIFFDPQRMLFSLMNKKGIRLYAERTEHPYVATTRALNNRKYLKACTKIDGLFVISTALKEFFIKNGARAEKVHIINMTVDTTRFKGLTKHESNSRYIAYCGSASNNKDGVNDLIKAFAIVHKKFPTIKLYIIGRPLEKKDESGNRRLVEQLGITDDVVFTGVVKAEQMPQLLKDAVLLALARPDSLQAQCGFPTKLGEYLLTENPVVVSKVGDIPLFLEDGKTALLSEQNNIEEFASKMEWVLEHPKESEVIGRNGAEVALNEFNCVKEAKKIIDIIK